ncbi:TIGR04255 family protein [Muricauda sp. SCSIO 64092]|uniref:TIGR04255 family protein n=1 Tax=Allomuricauda sp. SCSIO 64092 TaxID=2908842 RepID=UPI001FF2CC16|nr:TIGR04255 family protein [Muricauda sp. SCSIO 64092]UOY07760.1 TIGR04255 family protein [Muricauda sp. SCSIO 64092]
MFVGGVQQLTKKGHISKLPNSPLQEVIFELILNQEVDSRGNQVEHSFDLAQGVFNKSITEDFKHVVTNSFPPNIKIFPRIKYQYWTSLNQWPVVQIGPGIFTVNDTDVNYEWSKFYPLILENLQRLIDSYSSPLDINKISLRYLDAVEIDGADSEEKLRFINKNFNLNLINNYSIKDATMLGLNINQTYRLTDGSTVHFSIIDGKSKRNKQAVIWQTQINSSKAKTFEDISNWLDSAHSVTSDLFKDTITNDFYASFK